LANFAVRVLVNAAALFVAVKFVPNVTFPLETTEDWISLLAVALIFGLVNSYLRPLVRLLALPISLMTMGLIGFVINTAMLILVALLSDALDFGFRLAGWPGGPFGLDTIVAAFIASLVISVVSTVLNIALAPRRLVGF
jgi:putative membrane protein